MTYVFIDKDHETFYKKQIKKVGCDKSERKALFYLLGTTEETRQNINRLYNFKEKWIEPEALNDGWQTSTSIKVCRLAFNLYNNFHGEEPEDARDYTPCELLCNELRAYMMQAIMIRFEQGRG